MTRRIAATVPNIAESNAESVLPWLINADSPDRWSLPENRARYFEWLGEQLGFKVLDDWYQIRKEDVHRLGGGDFVKLVRFPARAVMEAFPDHDWKPWLFREAPLDYFKDSANRRRYMDWLGERLGFQKPEDWYAVTCKAFRDNHGRNFLVRHFNSSPVAALQEHFPDFDWKPWLFDFPGSVFWRSRDNRRQYLDWLGEKLGFNTPADWRQLRHADFRDNKGEVPLLHYRCSLARAMREYLPDHEWEDWLFASVNHGFWKKRENRVQYMNWLGKRLGYRRPEYWYKLTTALVIENHGGPLICPYYCGSVIAMLRDLKPEREWLEWKFQQVARRYFDDAAHRAQFLKWFAEKRNLRTPEDWYALNNRVIDSMGGEDLLRKAGGLCAALREWQPSHDWKEWLFRRSRLPFWNEATVRERYLLWLGKLLGLKQPNDWLEVRVSDFRTNHGDGLLQLYDGSVARTVAQNLPRLGLKEEDFAAKLVASSRRRSRNK